MFRIAAALALAAAALMPQAAAATGDALPRGSYLESCRELYVDGDTLYGECRDKRGRWKKTWISGYAYCGGDIFNNNGVLDCRGDRLPPPAPPPPPATPPADAAPDAEGALPPGPWTKTCRDAVVDGSVLRATCKDTRNVWRPTWIDLATCRQGEIANQDGLLVCVAPPVPALVPLRDTLPKGSWLDSCRSGAVKNYQMRAECYSNQGKWLISDLDLKRCKRGTVANKNGVLACD